MHFFFPQVGNMLELCIAINYKLIFMVFVMYSYLGNCIYNSLSCANYFLKMCLGNFSLTSINIVHSLIWDDFLLEFVAWKVDCEKGLHIAKYLISLERAAHCQVSLVT